MVNATSTAGFDEFWQNWWWLFVKGYHVMEYALLTALLYRALRAKLEMRSALAWSAILAFGYACSDEYHQSFVPGRGGKWTDVAIDTIGVTLVEIIVVLLSRWKREPYPRV